MASPLTPDNPFFSTTPSPDGDVPPALTPNSPGPQTPRTTMDHSEYLNWCSEHLLREFISRDPGLHQEAMQWSRANLEELFHTQRRLLQELNQPHREDREPSALAGIAVTIAYSCQIVLNRERNTEHKPGKTKGHTRSSSWNWSSGCRPSANSETRTSRKHRGYKECWNSKDGTGTKRNGNGVMRTMTSDMQGMPWKPKRRSSKPRPKPKRRWRTSFTGTHRHWNPPDEKQTWRGPQLTPSAHSATTSATPDTFTHDPINPMGHSSHRPPGTPGTPTTITMATELPSTYTTPPQQEAATMKNTVYKAARTITPFDPQQGHGDVEAYLMEVRQQVNYLGLLNEDSKITLITQSLAKGPKDWAFHYISEHHPTFDQFCHELCRKYQAPTSTFAKIKALMDKKQGRQESPRDFFDGLNQAYTRNLPPQDYNPNLLREAFLDNLHDDIKGLVMAMATKTTSMPEIVSHAQQIWLGMGKKKLEQGKTTEVLAINSAQQGLNLEGTSPHRPMPTHPPHNPRSPQHPKRDRFHHPNQGRGPPRSPRRDQWDTVSDQLRRILDIMSSQEGTRDSRTLDSAPHHRQPPPH
ncbi:hypothetical protein SKAU_G00095980 [Synaphobranchus kaupii]|uniref:Ty3 transposon capsid-like protein domain-containing protein n=1 Tax=Synaphobranchus kaupii TaxID=118154 RepID=A0A9Q1J4T4_SYNKA|nr:hypothetical protein SKAU_G00095980 [Synaphobranchus kaupii]